MKIELLLPDVPDTAPVRSASDTGDLFAQAYDQAAALLDGAQTSERRFAEGNGSLLEMTTARATADVALSTAVAVATRIGQLGNTLGNMSL